MFAHRGVPDPFRPLAIAALLVMGLLPLEANAESAAVAGPARSARPAPNVRPAPVIPVKPLPRGVWIGPPARAYVIGPHIDAGPPAETGWGLYVTAHGRSTNLAAQSSWTTDANVRPGEIQVGLGWRQENMSAMVGYVEPDIAGRAGDPMNRKSKGLVGLSVVLHAH